MSVDIHYTVEGDAIAVRRVQLSKGGNKIMGSESAVNVAAKHT